MSNPGPVIPVSELARNLRLSLEREFPLLWVGGEISNLTRAASGHVYFSLKDDAAQLRCVMFRSRAQALPWRIENGQQVEARVLPSVYEPRGDLQLNVESLRQAGLGRLYEAFARLKARLAADGLFESERKRALPRYPQVLGIVTSPGAAALRDVIATVRRRAPHLPLVLYPSLVQGELAIDALVAAIHAAGERKDCDLLLVVRGGGSVEDLWAFNEEAVARALAACPLPTITGVGHESDVTITDFVADRRAATPTAAAEMATQGWFEARGDVDELAAGLRRSISIGLSAACQRLDYAAVRLIHPAARLQRASDALSVLQSRLRSVATAGVAAGKQRLGIFALRLLREAPRTTAHAGRLHLLEQRLGAATNGALQMNGQRLRALSDSLAHLNPDAILKRGYAVVRDASGAVITDANSLARDQKVSLRFARGEAEATVSSLRPAPSALQTD